MLLTRLVEYADAHPGAAPPFYAEKWVRWQLDLALDGTPVTGRLQDLANRTDPDQRFGVRRYVPSLQRSGTAAKPMLAADTAEYALGWTAEPARQAKAAAYHKLFCEQVEAWATATGDVGAAALQAFYAGGHLDSVLRPEELGGGDLVVFRVGGRFVHDSESAQRYWLGVALGRKGSGHSGLCLVCGQARDLLQTIPTLLPTRLVPGATQTSGVALVSLNKRTHGYALTEQLVHSPICVDCGLKAMTALEALLSSETHSVTYPGQDARLAWWVTGAEEKFDLGAVFDRTTPEDVRAMLAAFQAGRRAASLGDLARFCAVVVGGNVSRVVVRDWIEMPLIELQDNLRSWFDDHEMIDPWTGQTAYHSVGWLARVTGRWIVKHGQDTGAYAPFGQKGADRPDTAYRELVASALFGRPVPPKLLAHLVHRIRGDGRRHDPARAALLRLALVRHPGNTYRERIMSTLNDHNGDPAYLAGRIFAALEGLQSAAGKARGDDALNVTWADKHFSRAVTNPAVSINQGRRDAQAWFKRLRRDKPGWAVRYDRLFDELFSRIADVGGVPVRNTVSQQSAFILGYHQQRAALFAKQADPSPGGTEPSELEGASA